MSEKSTSWIHHTLRSWILQQKLPPGIKINQPKLAKELDVSRTPVVKALHKLETDGLVDNIHQKGFYVHKLTVKELYELFLLRESLEKIVVSDLAKNITDKNLRILDSLFSKFSNKSNYDIKKYRETDQKFHTLLFEFSGNEIAKKINENYQVLNRTLLGGLIRPPEVTLNEHLSIINAIKNRDEKTVVKAMGLHDNKTIQIIHKTIIKLEELGMQSSEVFVDDITFTSDN